MKKAIFILFLVPALSFAQHKLYLQHFWDIPWGTSIEQAEAIYTERGLPFTREDNTLITTARYERENATIILLFNRLNRFYLANVVYSSTDDTVLSHYDKYRKVLFRRYGMPDTAVEYYSEPYKKGDGKAIEAIRADSAFHFTEWEFSDKCLASVSILKNINVCLTFKNPAYSDSAVGVR